MVENELSDSWMCVIIKTFQMQRLKMQNISFKISWYKLKRKQFINRTDQKYYFFICMYFYIKSVKIDVQYNAATCHVFSLQTLSQKRIYINK